MRHAKKRLQLNRFTSWRRATLISLASSLIKHQSIRTTLHKAKAAQPLVEKLILLARENTLAARRQAAKILNNHQLVKLLFAEIGSRFAKRNSGFTRIINIGARRGDNAKIAILELTEIIKQKKAKKQKKEKEGKPQEEAQVQKETEKPAAQKPEISTGVAVKEKPPIVKKPAKKFFGGIKSIFKKERDSL